MSKTSDEQIKQLKQTITEMESQRAALGDETGSAALTPLHKKLAELEANAMPSKEEAPESLTI